MSKRGLNTIVLKLNYVMFSMIWLISIKYSLRRESKYNKILCLLPSSLSNPNGCSSREKKESDSTMTVTTRSYAELERETCLKAMSLELQKSASPYFIKYGRGYI